jgi:hypothetical protein
MVDLGELTAVDLRSPKATKSCLRITRVSLDAYIAKRSI